MDGSSTPPPPSDEDLEQIAIEIRFQMWHKKLSGGGDGGTTNWKCDFYGQPKKSSYTRVRAHLLKLARYGICPCPRVTSKDIARMQNLRGWSKRKRKMKAPKNSFATLIKYVSIESSCDFTWHDPRAIEKERKEKVKAQILLRRHITQTQVRMFYTRGLPFRLARNLIMWGLMLM